MWLLVPTFMKTVYVQSDMALVRYSFDSMIWVSLIEGSSATFMDAALLKNILLNTQNFIA